MKSRLARFAVRPDPGSGGLLILGLSHPDIFEAGVVYEVTEFDGEQVIRKVGPSSASEDRNGLSWSRDANGLIRDGEYLFTEDEHRQRVAMWQDEDRAQGDYQED